MKREIMDNKKNGDSNEQQRRIIDHLGNLNFNSNISSKIFLPLVEMDAKINHRKKREGD
ncbi:MAG: hypothetical protein ACFE9S_20280 [Candidatus Hermodarchaeota archaeon]